MFKRFRLHFAILVYISLHLLACEGKAPLILTSAQRDQLDTLYAQRVERLGKELDSLCEVSFADQLPGMVDSIMAVRQAQEKVLREKYQKK